MSKSVLVVDDSAMMRKMIAKVLNPADYRIVAEATNGEEAIELYRSLHPEIVTMDITMRGMDGLTAAREILKIDPSAKILFLSNLDEDKYREEVDKIGGIGLVNKHKSAEILELVNGA